MPTHTGKFKKGVSGNPKGRPSQAKQVKDMANKIQEELGDEFKGRDSQHSLEKLLIFYNSKFDAAKTASDQERYAKWIGEISNKLIPFQKPRISSIESEDNRIKEITISWGEPEVATKDHPMIAAKKEYNPKDGE